MSRETNTLDLYDDVAKSAWRASLIRSLVNIATAPRTSLYEGQAWIGRGFPENRAAEAAKKSTAR